MRFTVLGSGSTGNAVLMNLGFLQFFADIRFSMECVAREYSTIFGNQADRE
jgi:hypothetical protein